MKRFDDWHVRLREYLRGVSHKPFRDGEHDCALFTAGAVKAMTGIDLAAPWRGSYTSLDEGFAALKRAGFDQLVDFAAVNFEEIAPAFAHPGDIAAVPAPTGLALGIVQGARIYVAGPRGLLTIPLITAHRAFRV